MTDVLIYFDADGDYGMGHYVRCKHLGGALISAGIKITFMSKNRQILNSLDEQGCDTIEGGVGRISEYPAPIIVIDRMKNQDEQLKAIHQHTLQKLVVIVGAGHTITWQTHWIADVVIYQAPMNGWAKGVPGERVIQGLKNIVVDPRYAEPVDPQGEERDLDFVTYFGAGAKGAYSQNCVKVLRDAGKTVHDLTSEWTDDPMPVFRRARRFVGSMGMVAYDAMANGLRPILISRDADHLEPQEILHRRLHAISVGLIEDTPPDELAREALDTLNGSRPPFANYAVDGIGVYRVARVIRDMLN